MTQEQPEEEAVVVQPIDETAPLQQEVSQSVASWVPKTEIGKKVKNKEITSIDEILDSGQKIMEWQIIDALLPNLTSDLLRIGQSKGKFGGGSRRVFRQTQKKTKEGNKPHFATLTVVGNQDGYVGIGFGKAKETVPAREKSLRNAKVALFKIARGSGSWEDKTTEPHTLPFAVEGKCGSVRIKLMPAPKGKGLCVEKECAKVLALAGIQDVWGKTTGQAKNKINLIYALEDALRKLTSTKYRPTDAQNVSMVLGKKPEVKS